MNTTKLNIDGLYSPLDVMNYLGALCNKPNMLKLKDNRLDPHKDLEFNRLHRIVYTAIENMALMDDDIQEIDGLTMSMFLSSYPDQYEHFVKSKGVDYVDEIKQMATNTSFAYALRNIRKFTLLRSYEKVGLSTKDIYNTMLIDPKEISEQKLKFDKLSEVDIQKIVKTKLDTIHENMRYSDADSYGFQAGDGIFDLIKKCQEEPQWGHSFQSLLFNAVFRGMLGKKVMIRSAGTGGGKSRQSIGDMCGISATKIYCNNTREWKENPRPASSLFITTELDKDEMQLAMLSAISGVAEETIKDGKYTPEVKDRLMIAGQVIKDSQIRIEYTSTFSLTDLESIIETAINKYDVGFVFFDYIQITSGIAVELQKTFGFSLREDQMLNLIVSCLKNLANRYNIFILTSTQLNRSYKTDGYLDATHLRGGMATCDKADYGVITMRASKADLGKLESIIETKINKPIPTHGHHVFKNRGGKYTGIIIWVAMNLDNMTVEDCYITNQDYEEFFVEGKRL
ncbi:DnaB-like helicase C-terminal domain-containing protein [Terrisporobacter sp.]|uniref:DnaB-like helicase C-terminal domain-containing protein n=1 Tax=Terrisporobacter sp. TaxID=1965305 RepID=UPI003990E325